MANLGTLKSGCLVEVVRLIEVEYKINIIIIRDFGRWPLDGGWVLKINVSKCQNSRSHCDVIDFFIFCLNKAYGKLFLKNALKGSGSREV